MILHYILYLGLPGECLITSLLFDIWAGAGGGGEKARPLDYDAGQSIISQWAVPRSPWWKESSCIVHLCSDTLVQFSLYRGPPMPPTLRVG